TRSRATPTGTSMMTSVAGTWCSLATCAHWARSALDELVASTTVNRPRFARADTMAPIAANASAEAPWSEASPDTRARNASEENTSPGAKCARAKVDLPDPGAPANTTSPTSGTVIVVDGVTGVTGPVTPP